MVITKTPLRISFFGGGTDYPDFYNEYGGEVLVSTIDKYSYIFIKKLSEIYNFNVRATYSEIEKVNHPDELRHPSMRECLKFMKIEDKIDISYIGELPAKSGLGSSSSFTVGFLNALHALNGSLYDNFYYGKEAIHVEQNLIKENVGSQDQMSTAIGGLNHIIFTKDNIKVQKLQLEKDALDFFNSKLALFYYGNDRYSSGILNEQLEKTRSGENKNILFEMKHNVSKSIDLLKSSNFDEFGQLMDYNWELKKKLSTKISNSDIDMLYELAIKNGAIGGKLLGAGSGGFLLFYIPDTQKISKIQELIKLPKVNFTFEDVGTSLIYKA